MAAAPERFDTIVIGSGQAGNPLAGAMAKAGRRTALIERRLVGGSCVNYGCTPSKVMAFSAEVAHRARQAPEFGVKAGPVSVDLARVLARKRRIVESARGNAQGQMERLDGLELVFGEARFTGPRSVEVRLNGGGSRSLSAETIIIDTGQRPARPPIEGIDRVPTLDSTSIMELEEVPDHLIVLGGGYVGLEFAQMFRRFGAEVTVIEPLGQLLSHEDPDIAGAMAEILRDDGITVLLGHKAASVEPRGGKGGGVRVSVEPTDGQGTPGKVEGSHLLVAAGRVPNTDALGLDAAGIETDEKGYIPVDEHLATGVTGVYAVGDVKGGPAFTHISYDDYRVLKDNLLQGGEASIAGRIVCYTVFTDPQLGRVGLSEREARDRGLEIQVARLPMSQATRASVIGEPRGLMKAVVDARTEQVVGASVLGVNGGELMGALQVAMIGRVPYTALRDAPFAHPTQVESFNNLFRSIE